MSCPGPRTSKVAALKFRLLVQGVIPKSSHTKLPLLTWNSFLILAPENEEFSFISRENRISSES